VKLGHRPPVHLPAVIRRTVLCLTVVATVLVAQPVDAPLAPPPRLIAAVPPAAGHPGSERHLAGPALGARRPASVDARAARARTGARVASARPDIDLASLRVVLQFATGPRALTAPPSARPHDVAIQTP
jgi:hypothetical protein